MARNKNIILRVSEKELNQIKEKAEKAQLSISEYLRTLAIYGEDKITKDFYMGNNDPIILRTGDFQKAIIMYNVKTNEVKISTDGFKNIRLMENNDILLK